MSNLLQAHSHYHRVSNWTMFPYLYIVTSHMEMEGFVPEPWGITPVLELYLKELQGWPH